MQSRDTNASGHRRAARRTAPWRRATALVLSWVVPATSLWASVPTQPGSRLPAPEFAPLRPFDTKAALASHLDALLETYGRDTGHPRNGPRASVHGAMSAGTARIAANGLPPELLASFLGSLADSGGSSGSSGASVTVFPSTKYVRTTGAKNIYVSTVTVPAWVGSPFTMHVQNGEANGSNRVSSGTIEVNGVVVAGTSDFNQNVPGFDRTVTLTPTTTLRVTLASKPCSYLYVSFLATSGDGTAPQVMLAEPVPGSATKDATPRLLVRYQDLVGTDEPGASGVDTSSLKVLLDGIDRTSLFTRRSDEASADLPDSLSLAEGPHTLAASIRDLAGNLGQASAAFRVDVTAPAITVVEPAADAVLGTATATVRVQYADPGASASGLSLDSLRVLVNGTDRTSLFTKGPSEAVGSLDGLTEGAVAIVASIEDQGGNAGTGSGAFSVDLTAPELAITQPTSSARLGSSQVEVIVRYSDAHLDTGSFAITLDGQPISLGTGPEGAMGWVGPVADGSHELLARIRDLAGHETTAKAGFSVDTTAPAIRVVHPVPGFVFKDATPAVEVEYSDAQGVDTAAFRLLVDQQDRTSWCQAGPGTASCTIPESLADGEHVVVASIRDLTANPASAESRFSVDTVAPQAALAEPAADSAVATGQPTLRLTYSDAGSGISRDSVHVFVDGSDRTASFLVTDGAATWTPEPPLADGRHEVVLKVADVAGNLREVTAAFTVDTAAPTAVFATPANDSFVNDPTPTIRLTYGDGAGSGVLPATVRIFLRNGAETEITPHFQVGASEAVGTLPDALALTDGTKQLRAELADRAGNTTTATAAFEVDTVKPTPTVEAPAAGAFVPTATPSVVIRYSDDRSGVAPASVVLTVDDIDRTAGLTCNGTGCTGTLAGLADGRHVLAVRVSDRAGNEAVLGDHAFVVDTVAPTAAVLVPADGAYAGEPQGLVRVTYADTDSGAGNGIDLASVRVFVDGADRTADFAVTATQAEATLASPLLDGRHDVRVEVVDWAAHPASGQAGFTVDTEAPVVAITTPAEDSYHKESPVEVTGTVVDLDPQVAVEAVRPDGTRVACTAGGSAGFACVVPLAEGENTVEVVARDRFAREGRDERRGLTLDTRAPELVIIEPQDRDWVGGDSVTVRGGVVDATASTVTVNDVPATMDRGSFTATVPLGAGPEEAVTVVATDAAGNAATTSFSLRVDRAAPIVTFTSPAEGAVLRGPSLEVRGTVEDGTPVMVEVNGQTATVSGTGGAFTFTAQVPAPDGALPLRAVARDAAGNVGEAARTVTVDTGAPVVTIAEPADGLVTRAASLRVSGTVADATAVTLVVGGTAVGVVGGGFSADVALPAEGTQTIVATAEDAAGNTGTASVGVVVDRTPPDLQVASPSSGAAVGALPLVVQGFVSDATPAAVTVDGTPAARTGNAWQVSLESLAEGPRTLAVEAQDAAGNTTSVGVPVHVDLQAPVVTITSPASGSLTRQAAVTVTGTVDDASAVTVAVGNGAQSVAAVVAGTAGEPGRAFTAAGVPLLEGDNTLTAVATDATGRTASADVLVTLDTQPPAIELLAPEKVARRQTVQAVATVTDDVGVESVTLRVTGPGTCTGGSETFTTPPYRLDLTVPDCAQAGDTLTVTADAADRAGNTATASRGVRVAGDGVLVGHVLSDATGLPLPGAVVSLLGAGQAAGVTQVPTDERGRYTLPTPDAVALLAAVKPGFTSVEREVAVESGVGTVPVDARLTRIAAAQVVGAGGGDVACTCTAGARDTCTAGPCGPGLTVTLPLDAVAGDTDVHLTPLSAQGLPGLLPLGWSPVAALDLRVGGDAVNVSRPFDLAADVCPSRDAAGACTTTPPSPLVLAEYRPSLHAWVLLTSELAPVDGTVTTALPGLGAFAFVSADVQDPPLALPAPGGVLPGAAMVELPATATATGTVDPAVIPPTGGTATGTLFVQSPVLLPSGTVVQTEITETYELASGATASEEVRRQDIVLSRRAAVRVSRPETCPEGALCATFPITPSRTYEVTAFRQGKVHLDILAGREAIRGKTGGSEPVVVEDGAARLAVPANALAQDTAVSVTLAAQLSPFVPSTGPLTALGEVVVDLSGQALVLPAELSLGCAALGDGCTAGAGYVVAQVERVEGIPQLVVVSLAALSGDRVTTTAYAGLPGIVVGGRYVVYRVSQPVGFVAGTVSGTAGPVSRAVLRTDDLPFAAVSRADGHYMLAALAGGVTVRARVPGTSLAGEGSVEVVGGQTASLDITVEGAVTQATVTPADGALGVAPNVQVEIATDAPLDPATATAANVTLSKEGGVPIDVRLVLSGSGKLLAIVPEAALSYSTTYVLEARNLADVHGGAVAVPRTSFRVKDFVAPFYDVGKIAFSFPDENGIVHVTAPACYPEPGCLYPGTTVLIINSANGVVLSLTAGNHGELDGEMPGTLDDVLLVTITDPFGNVTSLTRSQFTDAATGKTAVGAGGGTVEGPGGVELRIPQGALEKAATFKIEGLSAADLETQFPGQRPDFEAAHVGSGLRITSEDKPTFEKEVDLAFPVPQGLDAAGTCASGGAEPCAKDAFFYVYRRIERPCVDGGDACPAEERVAFEVIDHAFVEGEGAAAKVVTASRPFAGYQNSFGAFSGLSSLGLTPVVTAMTNLWWSFEQFSLAKARQGAITGKVLRQKWVVNDPGAPPRPPEYEGIEGALVSAADESGHPFIARTLPPTTIATTQKDGTFTLWDSAYTGGTIKIVAALPGGDVTQPCPVTQGPTDLVRCATAYEANPQDSTLPMVLGKFYPNTATATVTFPALEPPPPAPDVRITLFRRAQDGTYSAAGDLVVAGTALTIGVTAKSARVMSATIQGTEYATQTAGPADPPGVDAVVRNPDSADGSYTPAQPGSYTVTATALPAVGSPKTDAITFRVIASGGGVDTLEGVPPQVLTNRTVPKDEAKGVPVAVFPQVFFSEPVRNVPENLQLLEGGTAVGFTLSGVGPDGPVADVAPETPVTSVTLQPRAALKYNTAYTILVGNLVGDGIVDLDEDAQGQPTPRNLVSCDGTASPATPCESTFTTFGPEGVGGSEEKPQSPGIVVIDDRSYLVEIAGNWGSGNLRVFDVSDPASPALIPAAGPYWNRYVFFRPVDIVGEKDEEGLVVGSGGRYVVVATGPIRPAPSNLFLFDVTRDEPAWIGAASLTNSATDGIIMRVAAKGGRLYASTMRKGIQVVDLREMQSAFAPPPPDEVTPPTLKYFEMGRALATAGQGYGESAIRQTIPVQDNQGREWIMYDLKVEDYELDGIAQPTVVAAGQRRGIYTGPDAVAALLVVNPQSGVVPAQVLLERTVDGERSYLGWALALATGRVGSRPVAVVVGIGSVAGGPSLPTLAVLDMTSAIDPRLLAVVSLADPSQPDMGGWATDVVLIGDMAIVAGPNGVARLVSLASPDQPKIVGSLNSVGTKLAASGSLLFSNGGLNAPADLGGVQTAALGTVALVETDPKRIVVGEGPRSAEPFTIKYRVIPSSYEVKSAKLEFRVDEATLAIMEVPPLVEGRGQQAFPLGHTFRRVGDVLARPRLVVNAGTAEQLVSAPKRLDIDPVVVKFDWEDDQETVTADAPELGLVATSGEWYRRFEEATAESPAEQRTIGWQAFAPPATTARQNSLANDGIFENSLLAGTAAGAARTVVASKEDVVLGRTETIVVEPGVAAVVTVTADKASFAADATSEVLLTAEAKDAFGNPVADGTSVFWWSDGEGELLEAQEATQGGKATARYRAGSHRPQNPTIRAYVDDQVGEVGLQQGWVNLALTASRSSLSILDPQTFDLEVTATSAAGPVANGAPVEWTASVGKIEVTQPLTDGVAKARWVGVPGMPYRRLIQVLAFLGSARGRAQVAWTTSTTADSGTVSPTRTADQGERAVPGGGVLFQVSPSVPVATVEPMVIAGDRSSDGTFPLELPDGTVEEVPYKATAEYRVTGLTPGERVTVRLGSSRNPNMAPVALYRAEEALVEQVVADTTGLHDGVASGGVTIAAEGYRGNGFAFDGTGAITVPHHQEFEFGGGFMVQAAVRPPPGVGEQTLLEKAGGHRLALVDVAGEIRARFTVTTTAGEESVTSVDSVPAGSWSLLTGRFESGRLWVGVGDSEDYTVATGSPIPSASEIRIGAGYQGGLDEIRITDLHAPPLSTFPDGQQSISFVADDTGEFSTTIQSTGQLMRNRTSVAYRGIPGWSMRAAEADPAAGEQEASSLLFGQATTDTVTIYEDRATRSETTVGYVSNGLLAYAFKFVQGIWAGSGNSEGDLIVMAGDIVGSTVIGVITTPRDFINAAERAVRMQGDGWDAVTVVTALMGAAAVVASKKVKVIGKVGKLAKLLGRGDEAGPHARRIAREVLEKLDDIPGARSLDNVATIAAQGSDEAKAALKRLMDASGPAGGRLDLIEGVLAQSDEAEAIVKSLARARSRLGDGDFLDLLAVAGSCAAKAAARGPVRVAAVSLAVLMAAAPGASCPIWTTSALDGLADFTEVVQAARGLKAKGMQRQLMQHLSDRGKVGEVLEKVNHFAAKDPRPEAFADVLLDLGRANPGTSRGAERVLEMGYALVNPPVAGRSLRRFELPTEIAALRTKTGRIRQRRYDVVLDEVVGGSTKQVNVEVKAWTAFPPFKAAQLESALDQMRRDFVLHVTSGQSLSLSQIRWIFPDVPEGARPQLMSYFRNSLEHSPEIKSALARQGLTSTDIRARIDQYKSLIDGGKLIQFAP